MNDKSRAKKAFKIRVKTKGESWKRWYFFPKIDWWHLCKDILGIEKEMT